MLVRNTYRSYSEKATSDLVFMARHNQCGRLHASIDQLPLTDAFKNYILHKHEANSGAPDYPADVSGQKDTILSAFPAFLLSSVQLELTQR